MNIINPRGGIKHAFSTFGSLMLLIACSLLCSSQALAVGTAAGTNITNQAYTDYEDANGNPLTRVFSNTVTTTVSQVAGTDISPPAETLAGANENTVYFDLDIENTGNGDDVFDFTYTLDSGWTPTSVKFYHDANNDGVFDAGDTLIGTGAGPFSTDTLVPGSTVDADTHYAILVAVEIPVAATAADTTESIISVVATSQFTGTVTDSGIYKTVVASAVIVGVKTTSAVPSPVVPGSVITYTITLTNTGSTDGTGALVTDPIPAGLTYIDESITVDGVPKTDASDGDNGDYDTTVPGAAYVDVGTITAGGASVVIQFQATVDADVASGTNIQNLATIDYLSGGNPISETTNSAEFTVTDAAAISLTPASTVASGDPGDVITYAITVTNDGNTTDTIDVTLVSGAGWTWDLWYDANDDGIAGNDGDFLLTDTDGDGIVDTGDIPQGGSAAILATTTVPAGTADGTADVLVVTGTSSVDTGISNTTGDLTTTVTAPVLSVTKSVSPAGSQPPGTELTYTVTVSNTGSGTATNVVITDLRPTFTTYVSPSIRTGSSLATLTLRSDASDGDGGEYDPGSHSVIAGGSGTAVGSTGTFILEFKVTID